MSTTRLRTSATTVAIALIATTLLLGGTSTAADSGKDVRVVNGFGEPVPVQQQGTSRVTVENFPATQPVSGNVTVDNLPASQTVTGVVGIDPANNDVDVNLSDTTLTTTAAPTGELVNEVATFETCDLDPISGTCHNGSRPPSIEVTTDVSGVRDIAVFVQEVDRQNCDCHVVLWSVASDGTRLFLEEYDLDPSIPPRHLITLPGTTLLIEVRSTIWESQVQVIVFGRP